MKTTLVCMVVAFVVVAVFAAHDDQDNTPRADPEVTILESEMSQKDQQEAVAAIKRVWSQNPNAKRCDQLSATFKESHRLADWPCFKYPASAEEGAYSIGAKSKKRKHIRCLVKDATTNEEEHVVLFGVKKYL